MENIFTQTGIAIITFALTNIDDLILLSFYFSNPAYKSKHIISGQYLGIFVLVGISLTAALLGKALDTKWINLLGVVPLFLGVKDLILLLKNKENEEIHLPKPGLGIFNIALITIANGGDNIGVYTPLFASAPSEYIILHISIFGIMVAVWCMLGYYLVKHPLIKSIFTKYSHWLLPFFLIGLGIFLLKNSGIFQ